MVKGTDLAKAGCKYLGVSYETMDCQAFVEKCLKDCGLTRNLGGSNTWFRAMTWTGTPEECKRQFGQIPRGAFLFILENDGKEPTKYRNDGIGNASHIGLVTGMTGKQMVELAKADGNTRDDLNSFNKGDYAIHSSDSRDHVCTSQFHGKTINGGWNRIGLWSRIDYGEAVNQRLRVHPEAKPDAETVKEEVIGEGTVFAATGTTVKMRQRPSTGCGIYWDVPIGETVQILATGDWDRVKWNGRTGYMRSEYVRKDETMATIETDPEEARAPMLATVWAETGNTVKMRFMPSLDCNLYEKVPIGTQVAVNQKGDRWSKISIGNRSEWYMMTQFLKFEEE